MKIRELLTILYAFVIGLLPLPAVGQGHLAATRDDIAFVIPGGGSVPRFMNGRLVGVSQHHGAPTIYTADRWGHLETVNVDIAASDFTTVVNEAAGLDGSLAAVGNAISGTSRMGSFLAWIAPDRSRQVITRLWPYSADAVAIAPDGTIWTVGRIMNDHYMEVNPNVLRHYTPSGELLTSTLVLRPRKSIGGMYSVGNGSALMVSNDRVGWLTVACQYFEFSFDGAEMGRYGCPDGYSYFPEMGGAALSPGNDLVISTKQAVPLAPLRLDRDTKTWKALPVLQDSGNTNEILGFEGLTLVTRANATIRRYALSRQPTDSQ
jgi:hypothetical protein